MPGTVHEYELLIHEAHLDTFGHVNNAKYLEVLEEARWDFITRNGYGLDEVVRVMETNKIRRVPVVNQSGEFCGIVAQADIARTGSRKETGDLVREVSAPR